MARTPPTADQLPSLTPHGFVRATATDGLLLCPNDQARMEKTRIGAEDGDVTADRCNACGRLWLDGGEMQRLLADKGRVRDADAGFFGRESRRTALGARVCPRDGAELLEVHHPQRHDVVIEQCPKCTGVLLDAGELRQISGEDPRSWLSKIRKTMRW